MADTPRGHPDSGSTGHFRQLVGAPALSLLAALGAWLAILVQKVTLPALTGPNGYEILRKLGAWGEFGANLAAVSGIAALVLGLSAFMQPNPFMRWTRRGLVGAFALLLTTMTMWATFFERAQTATEIVIFGLGAAHVLTVLVITSALVNSASALHRTLAFAIAMMGMFGLLGHVAELLERTERSLGASGQLIHAVGEVGYLIALLTSSAVLLSRTRAGRESLARFTGFLLMGAFMTAFVLAHRALGADLGLILYHTQHVRLLLELSPVLYAVPLSLTAAMAIGALLSRNPMDRQVAIGSLLLIAGGYSPRSPGQLLVMALAAVLLARVIAATASLLAINAARASVE